MSLTNKEAILKAYKIANMPNDDTTLKEFIDSLFEDIDKRICANCKFYDVSDWVCTNEDFGSMVNANTDDDYPNVYFDFGCIRFEHKGEL